MSKVDLMTAKTWEETMAFYEDFAAHNPAFEPIHHLISQIAVSSYSASLFPATSMMTLMVAQAPRFKRRIEVLEIDFLVAPQKFSFQFWEHPTEEKGWKQNCEAKDAFATFERLIALKKWFK